MLFLNNTILFYLLFSQKLRVSISCRVVPYIQHSTVQPLLTNFLFHMKKYLVLICQMGLTGGYEEHSTCIQNSCKLSIFNYLLS